MKTADLAGQVCRAAADLGLAGGDYQLIHSGTNNVFVNRESGIIARVASDYISREGIRVQLGNCLELAAAGAPLVAPLVDKAVVLPGGRCASFWSLAETEPRPDGREMAEVLASCHRLAPPAGLIDWTPDLFVDRRWATLRVGIEAGLPAGLAESLSSLFADSLGRLKEVCRRRYRPASSVFIHGDTHHSNFVRQHGRLVLCDSDNICRGPREKDLANIWECCRRNYIDPQYWAQFKAAYPFDYDQELLDILTRVQEIGGCMWMCQFWGSRPESRSAISHNIDTVDQPAAHWLEL